MFPHSPFNNHVRKSDNKKQKKIGWFDVETSLFFNDRTYPQITYA